MGVNLLAALVSAPPGPADYDIGCRNASPQQGRCRPAPPSCWATPPRGAVALDKRGVRQRSGNTVRARKRRHQLRHLARRRVGEHSVILAGGTGERILALSAEDRSIFAMAH
jgi:hypothetical protein